MPSPEGDPIFDPTLFGREGGYAVRIMDLSGGNGSDPVEVIRGFATLEHANAFARRYVRDSVERCRVAGMTPEEVLAGWFAFGEDAEVTGGAEAAWRSAAELNDFAARPPEDAEDRHWRALDPRRDEAEAEAEGGMSRFTVLCGDFATQGDPEEEWEVGPFASAEAAAEYARRFIRAQIEDLRRETPEPVALRAAYLAFGEYATAEGFDPAPWVAQCIATPAMRKSETDYQALEPR